MSTSLSWFNFFLSFGVLGLPTYIFPKQLLCSGSFIYSKDLLLLYVYACLLLHFGFNLQGSIWVISFSLSNGFFFSLRKIYFNHILLENLTCLDKMQRKYVQPINVVIYYSWHEAVTVLGYYNLPVITCMHLQKLVL